jgi:hypothetical protein
LKPSGSASGVLLSKPVRADRDAARDRDLIRRRQVQNETVVQC